MNRKAEYVLSEYLAAELLEKFHPTDVTVVTRMTDEGLRIDYSLRHEFGKEMSGYLITDHGTWKEVGDLLVRITRQLFEKMNEDDKDNA